MNNIPVVKVGIVGVSRACFTAGKRFVCFDS